MNELWKDIPGFEGKYQASNKGEVRSIWGRVRLLKVYKKLAIQITWRGYCRVNIRRKNYYVHRLVAMAFYGRTDLTVDHLNSVKTDNRLENLEYCTALENYQRQLKRRQRITNEIT